MSRACPLIAILLAAPAMAQRAPSTSAQQRYAAEQLVRKDYEQLVAAHVSMDPLTDQPTASTPLDEYTPVSLQRWGVFTGAGEQLDAFAFAARVDDTPTLEQLQAAVERSRTRGWLATGLGAVALGGGVALVASAMHGDMTDDQRTLPSVAGAAVSFGGLAGVTMGLRVAIAPASLHRAVEERWSPERADELIQTHNDSLRQELGLEP
jgi:hypothetical protein